MEKEITYILKQLQSLTAIPSPSGYTRVVSDYVFHQLDRMGLQPQHSRKGNVTCVLGGSGSPLVLAAHLDTLGAMVRSITEKGRLTPTRIGGQQWGTADGENCRIFTRDGRAYTGVVLNVDPSAHVADAPVERTDKNMEILLDENVGSREEVLALGIQNGDIIALDPRTQVTPSGYIKSRFLDDKLSSAILLGLAHWVQEQSITLCRRVTLLFTVYEEVGHGAAVIPPDTQDMISVDMGCVGEDLSCTERMVSICAKDSGGPYNYELTSELADLARKREIPAAIDVYPHYGSDVEVSLRAGADIRHALIGPGVYASHNYERSHVEGMRAAYELLKAYITL